jgi:riboflavin transporter FmnP
MKRTTGGPIATKKDILEPNCRLIKTSRTLIFLFSLLSINALLMIVLPVTLLPRREILSLSVTPVPAIIESFCLWKEIRAYAYFSGNILLFLSIIPHNKIIKNNLGGALWKQN